MCLKVLCGVSKGVSAWLGLNKNMRFIAKMLINDIINVN